MPGGGAPRVRGAPPPGGPSGPPSSTLPDDDPDPVAPAILAGCLAFLARSAAQIVLVNLEDLLLERRPQNVPGTGASGRNWRRKMAVPLEELPRRES